MEMRHEFSTTGDPFDHGRSEQVGLNGRYSETFDTVDAIQLLHQPEKVFFGLQAVGCFKRTGSMPLSKITQVHSCQYDLLDLTVACDFPYTGHRIADGVAPAFSPGHGDRAEAAIIIAAILHFQ